jgi:hypothetical protein
MKTIIWATLTANGNYRRCQIATIARAQRRH